jgi:hypothetical protein
VAVNTDGKREIVGLHIGPSEAETVSVHGRGGESAGHGVCGGGVGGGWSSGLSAKVELRRFSPDREGDR